MTAKKKKPIIALAVVSALLTALILWIIWGNTALQLNKYTVSGERLPRAFDAAKSRIFRICTTPKSAKTMKLFLIC